jgi:hypothetical protein
MMPGERKEKIFTVLVHGGLDLDLDACVRARSSGCVYSSIVYVGLVCVIYITP